MRRRSCTPPGRHRPPAAYLAAALLLALALATLPAAAQGAAEGSLAEARVAFAYGVAAFQRGDYDTAVEELETAAANAPRDGRIHHWLGLAHLARGETRRAEEALRVAAGDRSLAADYRARVRSDLERVRSSAAGEAAVPAAPGLGAPAAYGALPAWELRLTAGYGEDDNPLLLQDGDFVLLPGGGFAVGPQSDDLLRLGVRGEVRPFADRGGWTLSLRGEAEENRYSDFDFLDLRALSATASLAWGDDPLGYVAGPLGYTRVPLGRRPVSLLLQAGWSEESLDGDGYRSRVAAAATVTVNEGRSAATRLAGAWTDRDYDRDVGGTFERSGSELSAAVDQLFFLGRRDRSLSVGVAAWQRDAGAALDASSLAARAALALPFGRRWSLSLGAAREDVEYDELESNPGFSFFLADRPREDTRTRLSASLTWAATERLLLTLGGRWSDQDADFGEAVNAFFDYDYDRAVITANVSWYVLGGGR